MADPTSGGEFPERMTEWTGQQPTRATMAEIGYRLTELGAGSAAIVGCDWNRRPGGHWFNALNDAGTLKAVDAQYALVGPWPPSRRGVGFDEDMFRVSDVIFFDPDGKVVRN